MYIDQAMNASLYTTSYYWEMYQLSHWRPPHHQISGNRTLEGF